MEEFYLFLDESKPNSNFNNFTLGGVIIKKDKYEKEIVPLVNQIKQNLFNSNNIILHEIDIRQKRGEFQGVGKQKQEEFFKAIGEIFANQNLLTVLAVSINLDTFNKLFNQEHTNSIYYIALQVLMQNFTHFLINNNGRGTIFLESTEPVNNTKLQNLFHMLKATGTLYIKRESLQDRLNTINFAIKSDNNIGLQLADFVPNPLSRVALGKSPKPYSIIDSINKNLYGVSSQMENRFGFKIIK